VAGDRADDGRPEGRAADEDEHVEPHHATAQLRVDRELDRCVGHGLADQVGEAHRGQQEQEGGQVGGHRGGRLEQAERGRRDHDHPHPRPVPGRGEHRADGGAEPDDDVEQAVGPRVAAEGRLRHRGQHDREVKPERAEHPDQEDRPQQVRAAAHVAHGRPHGARGPGRDRRRPQVGRAQH
jgi:hypothetical protein